MGRPEQRKRKRKKAAASCQRIDSLLTAAAKRSKESPSVEADDNAQLETVEMESQEPCCSSSLPVSTSSFCENPASPTEFSGVDDVTESVLRTEPAPLHVDIGDIVAECSSEESVHLTLRNLPNEKKYSLLKHHSQPPKEFVFPTTYIGGCNRSFRSIWLNEYPWLVYSSKLDGGFCVPCALFSTTGRTGKFLTRPFSKWNKKSMHCSSHEKAMYHEAALKLADEFIQRYEHPETELQNQLDQRRAAIIEQNRKILKSIIRAVLFCGRQCIALRGDSEHLAEAGNAGNLLELLRLLAINDELLHKHLNSPSMRNASYLSHRSQNEILEVLVQHMILRDIIDEVKQADFYAILADEITSHNQEYLALCVRFVAKNKAVREEFLGFLKLNRITGQEIAGTIIKFLQEQGIPLNQMRGQGYDGAANMSSERVGVQKRIQDVAPLATYIHCHSHSLNLVITKSCSLPEVRNVLDRLNHFCRYFLNSPKRSRLLKLVVSANVPDVQKRKPLLDLCKTRWAERHSAYQHFYQAYVFVVQALELIGYSRHTDKYGDGFSDWDPANRSEAQQILSAITSSTFLVGFVCIYQYLSHLSGITVKLQRRTVDILQAFEMVADVKKAYFKERDAVES